MLTLKKFFRIGILAFSLIFLLNLTSCNSGSKDTVSTDSTVDSVTATDHTNAAIDSTMTTTKVDSAITTTNNATEVASAKVENHVVTIENMKFNPAIVTIKKGDKVTFINKDIVAHTATEIHNLWGSPLLQNEQSWSVTPDKTADYYCTVHVVMKGKIIVK